MKARNLIIADKDTNQTKTSSEKTGRNERVIKLVMPKYKEEEEKKEDGKTNAQQAAEAAQQAAKAAKAAQQAAQKEDTAAREATTARDLEQRTLEMPAEDIPFD